MYIPSNCHFSTVKFPTNSDSTLLLQMCRAKASQVLLPAQGHANTAVSVLLLVMVCPHMTNNQITVTSNQLAVKTNDKE